MVRAADLRNFDAVGEGSYSCSSASSRPFWRSGAGRSASAEDESAASRWARGGGGWSTSTQIAGVSSLRGGPPHPRPLLVPLRVHRGKMRSRYIGRSFSEKAAEEHGLPDLVGLRPEDVYPVEVARERAETERRYAGTVAARRSGLL